MIKYSKRLLLANALSLVGCGLISYFVNRKLLFVFNYHRIRPNMNSAGFIFDDGVYGPNLDQFTKQLEFLQKHTTVLCENDLIKLLAGDMRGKGPYSVVTFDDAYIDNYNLALPELKKMGIPAIFFVPALLVENREVGWWDKIAYIIKKTNKTNISFGGKNIQIKGNRHATIRHLQSIVKTNSTINLDDFINELEIKADSVSPSSKQGLMEKELMNWEQIIEAHEAGIGIGSHTSSHRILSSLDKEEQAKEIIGSKIYLEEKLGIKIKSLAFPVGGPNHFDKITLELSEKAGYDLAFSFNNGGAVRYSGINRFNISRLSAPQDLKLFKAMVHFPSIMV
ncbi:MAG: polysaccharide deacetylase family protein [Desulfocapsaceae bacterium]|nr:polysaccharide deacetylase family protein [Desulfocapsaceae bacterium]